MAHDRNLGVEDCLDGFDALQLPAFDLDRMGARLDEPAGVAHRLFVRDVIREVRHVADDERALRTAHDGARVMDHVVHGHAERIGITEDHHAEGVADKNDVGAGGVGDFGAGKVVGGEHAEALHALHRLDSRDRHSFLFWHLPSSAEED